MTLVRSRLLPILQGRNYSSALVVMRIAASHQKYEKHPELDIQWCTCESKVRTVRMLERAGPACRCGRLVLYNNLMVPSFYFVSAFNVMHQDRSCHLLHSVIALLYKMQFLLAPTFSLWLFSSRRWLISVFMHWVKLSRKWDHGKKRIIFSYQISKHDYTWWRLDEPGLFCSRLVFFVFSAWGGIRTGSQLPVLTDYFPRPD